MHSLHVQAAIQAALDDDYRGILTAMTRAGECAGKEVTGEKREQLFAASIRGVPIAKVRLLAKKIEETTLQTHPDSAAIAAGRFSAIGMVNTQLNRNRPDLLGAHASDLRLLIEGVKAIDLEQRLKSVALKQDPPRDRNDSR